MSDHKISQVIEPCVSKFYIINCCLHFLYVSNLINDIGLCLSTVFLDIELIWSGRALNSGHLINGL